MAAESRTKGTKSKPPGTSVAAVKTHYPDKIAQGSKAQIPG